MATFDALPDQVPPTPDEAAEQLLEAPERDVKVPVQPDRHDQPEEHTMEPAAPDATAPPQVTPEDLGLELPADPAEAEQLLLRELAEARREADEYLDNLKRLAAEFDNYRKRVERDQIENVKRASERVVAGILPTLDSFDAALAFEPQSPGEEKLLEGMRSTYAQLMEALAREGLEVIAAEGEVFDPAVHEAVAAPPGGGEDLVVTDELRRGYTLHGKVIRPALVRVDHADDA